MLLTYAVLPLLWRCGLPLAVLISIAGLSPLALWQGWCMRRGDWQAMSRWNALAFNTLVLLMGTALLELVGFVWLILVD